jgi:hypothetical protein
MFHPARTLFAAFFIVAGLGALFGVDVFKYFWPLILIVIGINMLTPRKWGSYRGSLDMEEVADDRLDYSAVFSGINRRVVSNDFRGGKVDVVFGGGELDLTGAKIAKGAKVNLEVNAVFGGIKVIVPKTWVVQAALTGVVGGFSNTTKVPERGKETGTLVVKGAAVFGGGEIVN